MAKTADSFEKDDEVLRLRRGGRSFSAIARELSLGRAVEANEAFNRALRRCPDEERKKVVAEELRRLDRLESAPGQNGDEAAAKKRERAIKALRARLPRD
jgi:predicted CopG family antitoxin